jgi:alkanesulfonate monooxygenase SsuD/methylene tetrahydromethanopterin reductase-like flavin-dependent oxidoreductase (luciferase family)
VTSRARVGTLVTNPVLRPPGLVVRQALAVDHLSSGRLQLGIGTGIARFDHEATGISYWPLDERLARFREYIAFVDAALRSGGASFTATGQFFAGQLTGLPEPVQSPRPPMTVAGASKGVRAVAAERAECWNTHGAFGVAPEDLIDHLSTLNGDVSVRCEAAGRDPNELCRSVLLLASLSPWTRAGRLPELVEVMSTIGFEEIVVFWPWNDEERAVFEHDASRLATLAA